MKSSLPARANEDHAGPTGISHSCFGGCAVQLVEISGPRERAARSALRADPHFAVREDVFDLILAVGGSDDLIFREVRTLGILFRIGLLLFELTRYVAVIVGAGVTGDAAGFERGDLDLLIALDMSGGL